MLSNDSLNPKPKPLSPVIQPPTNDGLERILGDRSKARQIQQKYKASYGKPTTKPNNGMNARNGEVFL